MGLPLFQADPQKVCTALGLCSAQVKKSVAAQLIFNSLPLKERFFAPKKTVISSKPYRASATCILCEYVMTTLKGILNENSTKVRIKLVKGGSLGSSVLNKKEILLLHLIMYLNAVQKS